MWWRILFKVSFSSHSCLVYRHEITGQRWLFFSLSQTVTCRGLAPVFCYIYIAKTCCRDIWLFSFLCFYACSSLVMISCRYTQHLPYWKIRTQHCCDLDMSSQQGMMEQGKSQMSNLLQPPVYIPKHHSTLSPSITLCFSSVNSYWGAKLLLLLWGKHFGAEHIWIFSESLACVLKPQV